MASLRLGPAYKYFPGVLPADSVAVILHAAVLSLELLVEGAGKEDILEHLLLPALGQFRHGRAEPVRFHLFQRALRVQAGRIVPAGKVREGAQAQDQVLLAQAEHPNDEVPLGRRNVGPAGDGQINRRIDIVRSLARCFRWCLARGFRVAAGDHRSDCYPRDGMEDDRALHEAPPVPQIEMNAWVKDPPYRKRSSLSPWSVVVSSAPTEEHRCAATSCWDRSPGSSGSSLAGMRLSTRRCSSSSVTGPLIARAGKVPAGDSRM